MVFLQKWSDLPAYVNQLHNYNMKVLVEVDPVLSVTSPELERAKDSVSHFCDLRLPESNTVSRKAFVSYF